MYDLVDDVPVAEIDPGTNVLIVGPPMVGKRTLAYDILRNGIVHNEGTIVVTTKDSGDKVLEEFTGNLEGNTDHLGIVDCVTKQRGIGTVDDDPRIKYASSPVDMTGIGINLSEYLQEFYEGRGVRNNRVLVHSVSTLLMYSNLQTVFRFLHVFTGRIQSADALGLYVIDATAHDEQTMNTLKQLFDGVITVEDSGGDEPTIETAGL
ncbi:RAD55 family ATPase [Natrarchaeobaculum sulfurireducens]|uniref:KaiC-like protein ATPase n=1 Tax=Natrarchaeobaculum sulfurireducens TaxID=2044521 RepID=A0A346PG30_9EURY|nr:recombinase RecA [Natrarchaeobaculum sulfurireducens]AXR78475.1 KaiC-like protein ATPase [Natrarchaeobaculum sulfurireducens]AXR81452.1 recombinase RecA [Natrarchaeobaculum sulfurireducens]